MILLSVSAVAFGIFLIHIEVNPAEKWFREAKARLIGALTRRFIDLIDRIDRALERLE